MEEFYEGKRAIVTNNNKIHFNHGEIIELVYEENVSPTDEKIIWYTFDNMNGRRQVLIESEFEWLEKES